MLTFTTPNFSIQLRLHSTDHSKDKAELPFPLVQTDIDFTQSVNLTESDIAAVNDLKEVNNEKLDSSCVKTSQNEASQPKIQDSQKDEESVASSPAPQPASDKTPKKDAKKSSIVVSEVPRPGLLARAWLGVKGTAVHYWDGAKLLTIEVKILSRSTKKIVHGQRLTRREKQQVSMSMYLFS